MKKSLFVIVLILSCFFSIIQRFAWETPDNCYYIDITVSQLGNGRLYIPFNAGHYFSTSNSGNALVNTSSSQVNAYFDNGSYIYNVRFPSFDKPTARRQDLNTGTYNDFIITSIVDEGNLPLITDADLGIFNHSSVVNMRSLLLIGVICIICIMRL